jgi:OPA family glycerol-3-phosphate transporter-like MFS transporter/OPA family sugar phosphate sensor protein UhpC-like MFS transporter
MKLFDDDAIDRRFGRLQWRMLFATMIGYTLFYFLRKNFSFAMPGLQQDCGISKPMLGNFLFWGGIVYGLSKFVNGIVGDKAAPKKMFCLGLFACVLVNVAFGFAPQLASLFSGSSSGETSPASALAWTFGILLVLSQFFQGTGFPPCAKLIAFWIPPKELATKMSVWNTSHSVGGGLVAKVCGVIMGLGVIGSANQGVGMWRWCFWSMAILGLAGLLLMVFLLPGTPKEEGLPDLPGTEAEKPKLGDAAPKGEMMRMVFLNPVIWMLGLVNFTINAVRALIADWGPTMLQEAKAFDPSETGTIVMLFEFAGIGGMLVSGWATDRFFGGRAPRLCLFLMVLTAAMLAAFWFLPAGIACAAALCMSGFFLYGPQALTGVTATNLATKRFAGTAIGFISLFSYVGVSVAGKVCGDLAHSSGGWALPIFAIAATSLAGAVLFAFLWCVKADAYGK